MTDPTTVPATLRAAIEEVERLRSGAILVGDEDNEQQLAELSFFIRGLAATPQADPAEPGLRAAAQAYIDAEDLADSLTISDGDALSDSQEALRYTFAALRAALATTEPDGLDVERLARAMNNVGLGWVDDEVPITAANLAAEYARLRESGD